MNKRAFYKTMYTKRFEIFFSTLIAILFGSIVVPEAFYETVLSPILFLLNLAAGTLLISHRKKFFRFFAILFVISLLTSGFDLLERPDALGRIQYIRLGVYFLFYIVVTIEIIRQVWKAKEVNKNVIMGLMSGYICLGLLGFFLFMSLEVMEPGSFFGLLMDTDNVQAKIDSLIYYSYITLLTIGYGEIYPATAIAQKAAILIGLVGQFYLVIVTAVVVEKYIRHTK